jgi:hypothetical protein
MAAAANPITKQSVKAIERDFHRIYMNSPVPLTADHADKNPDFQSV